MGDEDETYDAWLVRHEAWLETTKKLAPSLEDYKMAYYGGYKLDNDYRGAIKHTVYGFLTFIERYILERQEAGEVEEFDKKPESEQKELLRNYGYTGSGPFQRMRKSLRRSFGNTSNKSINTDAFRNARIKYLLDLKIKELKDNSGTFKKLFTLYDKFQADYDYENSILKTPELKVLIDNETRYPLKFIYSYISNLPESNTKREYIEDKYLKYEPELRNILAAKELIRVGAKPNSNANANAYAAAAKVIDDTKIFEQDLLNLFPTPGNAGANAAANAAANPNPNANAGANAERDTVPLLKGGMRKNKAKKTVKKTRKNKEKKTRRN